MFAIITAVENARVIAREVGKCRLATRRGANPP